MINQFNAKETQKGFLKGAEKLFEAVAPTLGPKGKNIVIKVNNEIKIINDGYSIANIVYLHDDLEDVGAQVIKEVSKKANQLSGDGTSTAIVLAYSLMKNGFDLLETSRFKNINVLKAKDLMNERLEHCIEYLKTIRETIDITEVEKMKNIAMISTNYNKELSDLIVKSFSEVTADGYVMAAASPSVKSYFEIGKGLRYESGYASKFFINKKETMSYEAKNAMICFIAGEVNNEEQILGLLEFSHINNQPLIIMAEKFSSLVLGMLIENRMNGIDICVVESPGPEFEKEEIMCDMISACGGIIFNEKNSLVSTLNEEFIKKENFGRCKKITVTDKKFVIETDEEFYDKERVEERIQYINNKYESSDKTDYFYSHYEMRKSKLKNGIAVIYVGGQTPVEIEEKRLRAEDAINSVQNALKEGYLSGGGSALYSYIYKETIDFLGKNFGFLEEEFVFKLFQQSLISPLSIICKNAGINPNIFDEVIFQKNEGINVITEQKENMIDAGVIDPFVVTVNALKAAVSIASVSITMGGSLIEERAKDAKIWQG